MEAWVTVITLPATATVALLAIEPVFDATVKVAVPSPLPDPPEASVSHEPPPEADHAQPEAALTEKEIAPLPAAGNGSGRSGDTVYVQNVAGDSRRMRELYRSAT